MLKITAVIDCGTAKNPNLAKIQVEGALVQGIGMALFEEANDSDLGRLLNNNLMYNNSNKEIL